ncbi:SDR family NAD(P)-dependent oxidoreductase [Pararobbsia silviterrae]|uniref:SDR family oxidoreductase n=1 Tax=Pararobbsia silviterrae TaxID=1792498 RepID=A0A494XM22_9BURK|nr:SDR family oxidoreductase [Pararobbsia silviterrae]RKP51747.1 SDR family oxidoreductase [Pararobbsia silviterrae]
MTRINDLFSVEGKRIVVTGGASGIGYAIAEAMTMNGALVGIVDMSAERMEAAAQRLAQIGRRPELACANLANPDEARASLEGLHRVLGGLDVLFANAGISGGPGFLGADGARVEANRFEAIDPGVLERTLSVNVGSVFHSAQAVVPLMKAAGQGRIVVTSSISASKTELMVGSAYVASKGAVGMLVRQLAHELAGYGILVNAICPGPTATQIAGGRLQDAAMQDVLGRFAPLGRIASPQDIQGVALLLASRAGDYITGTEITVDGGTHLGPVAVPDGRDRVSRGEG